VTRRRVAAAWMALAFVCLVLSIMDGSFAEATDAIVCAACGTIISMMGR
jgi:hypothetical protein